MQVKKTLQKVYVAIIVVMAVATIIGKYTGLDYVSDNIFGAWWFSLLWAIGTALGIVYFIKQKVRRPIIVLLHLSFVVILAGALLTHLTAKQGIIHLRQGKATTIILTKMVKTKNYLLPFCSTNSAFLTMQEIWLLWTTHRM